MDARTPDEDRGTALLNLLAKVQKAAADAEGRYERAVYPDWRLQVDCERTRARLDYLTDYLTHRFHQPEPGRAVPGPHAMDTQENRRLLHLERRTAAGETLTQAEVRELETLRDLAGQTSLGFDDHRLSPDEIAAQEKARQRDAQRREIAERLSAPLKGFDGGAQASLFGEGMLF